MLLNTALHLDATINYNVHLHYPLSLPSQTDSPVRPPAVGTLSESGGISLGHSSWEGGRSATESRIVHSRVWHLAVVPATSGPPLGHPDLHSGPQLLEYTPEGYRREGGRKKNQVVMCTNLPLWTS